MTVKELAMNWIENADVSPERISAETAAEYIGWMDPDNLPEDLTAEAFADAWNEILDEGRHAVRIAVDYMRLENTAAPNGKTTLEALYEMIGCDVIEIVHVKGLPKDCVMIVDEEGLLKGRPSLNVIASYLYGTHEHGSPIVGNAVIMKEVLTPEGGSLAWLTAKEALSVERKLERIWFDAVITMSEYYRRCEEDDDV